MNLHQYLLLSARAATLAVLLPMMAITEAAAMQSGDIETVVVTARLRSEELSTVPVSITAIDGATIEAEQVNTFLDLAPLIPNFSFDQLTGLGFATPTIRGIGATGPTQSALASNPSTGIYVDGVDLSSAGANLFSVLDVERVEVLRGPQGTLYGRNTIAGVINIVTKAPTDQFESQVRVGYGNYNDKRLYASASGPLGNDKILGRIGIDFHDHDGYVKNRFTAPDPVFGESDKDADSLSGVTGRASVEIRPDADVNLRFSGDYSRDNGTYLGYVIDQGTSLQGFAGYHDDHVGSYNQNNGELSLNWGAAAQATVAMGDYSIVSISGYRKSHYRDNQSDIDATPTNLYSQFLDAQERSFSQEVRLHHDTDRYNWVLGGYFFYGDGLQDATIDFFGYLREAGMSGWSLSRIVGRIQTNSYAIFGNFDGKITDDLHVEIGGRLGHSTRAFDAILNQAEDGGRYYDGAQPYTQIPPGVTITQILPPHTTHANFGRFVPRISIRYDLNPGSMVYASWSQGYRDGGFSTRATTTPYYGPESLTAYEAGVKSSLFDNMLSLNGAIYYNDLRDQQVEQSVFLPSGSVVNVYNAGMSEAYGLELEFIGRPFEHFQLSGNLGYEHTEFLKFTTGTASYVGNVFPRAPEYTASLNAQYAIPVTDDSTLTLRGEWTYRSTEFFTLTNDPAQQSGDHSEFNASAAVDIRDNLRILLWGKNLADTSYPTRAVNLLFMGYYIRHYSMPRTFGASVEWHI